MEQILSKLVYLPISDIKPDPRNPRKHTAKQVAAIGQSVLAFGFNAPILVDRNGKVVVGHGRLESAKLIGLTHLPVIFLDHLSDAQVQAYMIADNRLTDCSTWDEKQLAINLEALSTMSLEFTIEATGFEIPEIDVRIQSLDELPEFDPDDTFAIAEVSAVSQTADLWMLGEHRLLCGDALEQSNYDTLMGGKKASAVFADFPCNVKIDGHVSGKGSIKHREFAMASGEMSPGDFTAFLTRAMQLCCSSMLAGGLLYGCMDFRHMREIMDAACASGLDMLNLCVWVKTNGGMGSFYRSKHELIFVYRKPGDSHINNIQLGRFGRNRTNVWNYAGANVRPRKGAEDPLSLHPTVKPVMLVADAMRDATSRGEIVLDPFAGSGTTLLAAERVGRRGYAIEIDPLYVDTAIRRWQRKTGKQARHVNGAPFDELAAQRGTEQ